MTLPSLNVAAQGISQTSADNLNTFVQGCNVVADLRAFIGLSGMKVFLGGYTSNGDGGQGIFYWNANGNSPDDGGITTIVPNGAASGEWTRETGSFTPVSNSFIFPMGRLTLSSGISVMISDQTAKTTIYYTPYVGSLIPIYNGTGFVPYAFSQISLQLDSNSGHTGYQKSGFLFDIFAFRHNSSTLIGTGPAWDAASDRGAGGGTTQIGMLNGIWTNTVSIALKPDATSTRVTVAVGQATYLGTMYATSDGQTGVVFKPPPSPGGTDNIIGLYNAYNRVPIKSICQDSTAAYTYTGGTWEIADGSTANRVTYVDGLQQEFVTAAFQNYVGTSTAGSSVGIGVNLNDNFNTPNVASFSNSATGTLINNEQSIASTEIFTPQLGLNFLQAMEIASQGTFNTGGGSMALIVSLTA